MSSWQIGSSNWEQWSLINQSSLQLLGKPKLAFEKNPFFCVFWPSHPYSEHLQSLFAFRKTQVPGNKSLFASFIQLGLVSLQWQWGNLTSWCH